MNNGIARLGFCGFGGVIGMHVHVHHTRIYMYPHTQSANNMQERSFKLTISRDIIFNFIAIGRCGYC